MKNVVFAEPVGGSEGSYLVTLDCGHKVATRHRRVAYRCPTCEPAEGEPPRLDVDALEARLDRLTADDGRALVDEVRRLRLATGEG